MAITKDDLNWLREYAISAAQAANSEFCVGESEWEAAERNEKRAEALFDEIERLVGRASQEA